MSDTFNPTPEHRALRELVRGFVEREVRAEAMRRDREEAFDLRLFRRLGELGVLGVLAPEQFGGAGMDASAAVIVHEELSAGDPGFALACLSHSVLFVDNLARYGSKALCARLLPDVCGGKRVGGIAMSEPNAGSDLLAMRTRARREGNDYLVTGTKTWITNGAIGPDELGDLLLVYARTSDQGMRGISLFLVERGTPGFSLGRVISGKLGMRSSLCAELVFDGCVVPEANRLGAEGSAVIQLMRTLEVERLVLAAISLGIARRALELMNNYAGARQAFAQPLRSFGQIQRHLAESYAAYRAGRAYVYQTAGLLNIDRAASAIDTDGAKLFCATIAKEIADRAIQVLGANGYVADYEVERLWRDARLIEIGGGTNEILQRNISRNLARLTSWD